jgi:peptide/nickel transport system substrate-binding protein
MVLAACSSAGSPASQGGGTRVQGGTATVALAPGEQFNYVLPLLNLTNDVGANIEYSEYLMWRPLYWFGGPNHVGLNEKYSLAETPTVTTTNGHTVATIQLKHWLWSDGTPVTTRDVEFWFNILKAAKANWWDYVPGQFPDNVTSFKSLGTSRFSLTFTGKYDSTWLYNELAQLIPVPQHSWDKESASGKVGNYDLTASGAKAVYNFLSTQNKDLSTYATNPLWQVVDGPWKISHYIASTGDVTYVRNYKYSGPATGSLHALKVVSETSDSAEFDSLLASGGINYGYVPFNDAAQIGRVKSQGYQVQDWPAWGITYITPNFGSPAAGPAFKQLYIRQSMQRLINQASYISSFLQGHGNPTYGPVPLVPASQFVSSAEKSNPYPYDPTEAVSVLKAHGWKINKGGTDVCIRPGSGPAQCGKGITAGTKLAFSLEYSTGVQAVTEEVAALQSSFSQAGIQLSLKSSSYDTVISDDIPCAGKSSCWQLNYYGQGWYFTPSYNDPDGSAIFNSKGVSNSGAYDDPHADQLMSKLPSGGITALYAYEDYLAKQLPMLWLPQLDEQISAVSGNLRGVYPQDPIGNIYPENWYFVK